jgi:hypothetical protein
MSDFDEFDFSDGVTAAVSPIHLEVHRDEKESTPQFSEQQMAIALKILCRPDYMRNLIYLVNCCSWCLLLSHLCWLLMADVLIPFMSSTVQMTPGFFLWFLCSTLQHYFTSVKQVVTDDLVYFSNVVYYVLFGFALWHGAMFIAGQYIGSAPMMGVLLWIIAQRFASIDTTILCEFITKSLQKKMKKN